MVPLYYQMRETGLLNTRWAIILPLIGLVVAVIAGLLHVAGSPVQDFGTNTD